LRLTANQILHKYFHAYFHRTTEDPIHGGVQFYPLPNPHGVKKAHLVHRGSDDDIPGMAHGGHGPGKIDQMHHFATQQIP